jgi:flagellar basal-body rod protein FlgB
MMFGQVAANLESYMTLLADRQRVVASNIANVDTPGYKTKDIDFRSDFLSMTQGGEPTIIEPSGLVSKPDGNNVSLDRESRLLAENALRFNIATNFARTELSMVRDAIDEGKNS